MYQTPAFQTLNLWLKPMTLADVAAYNQHFIDYEVVRFLSDKLPWPYPKEGVQPYFEQIVFPAQGKTRWSWGIFLKEEPEQLIGCIEIFRLNGEFTRGFWLGKEFWGKGYMTEAIIPVIHFGFRELKIDRFIFINAVGNEASRKLKVKTGCTLLKTRPSSFVGSEFTEEEVWELKKKNWKLV